MNNVLFTKRNLIRAFAIAIPIFIIKLFEIPFEFLLRDITPTFELGVFVAISNMILTIAVSVIAVLICIKIWNKSNLNI